MKSKLVKLAIFDIDGTIFRSSLVVELVNGMVEHGVFPALAKKELEKEYRAWQNRKGDYTDYIRKVVEIHLRYIAGRAVKDVHSVAKLVVDFEKDRVYRYTRDLIKKLNKQGFVLLAISGSPTYIVSEFAKTAGFHAYFGSQYEIENGMYTGNVLNLDSVNKKSKVVKTFLEEKKLVADFKKSFAIGDTESDSDILQLVGHPIAFNPNAALAKLALQKKWKVVVERKDVIYEVKEFKFI